MSSPTRVVILGAGGRDFHVFNTCYRDDPSHVVIAFTATQIPDIHTRTYPPVLAGPLYKDGIPILRLSDLEWLIRDRAIAKVIFAFSDVTYDYVETMAHHVRTAGARLEAFDPDATMLKANKPCVAVCATRTGCGKSGVTRHVAATLRELGRTPVVVRHPMAYGDLQEQVVQRFASLDDLKRQHCTIEEMEEYEPHIEAGNVVFSGADCGKVLEAAEAEGDIVVWDGGNNDTPFLRPDLLVTLVDPLRPGHELTYFPGRWNLEHADAVVIVKSDEARDADLQTVLTNVHEKNPDARVFRGDAPIWISDAEQVRGKRALVIEDGPTATHGGMGYGAGLVAAMRAHAEHIVDPRPYAVGRIAEAYLAYPHLRAVVPALGYGEREIADLEATIERADCDVVVIGTPTDLTRLIRIDKPCVRVTYGFAEASKPGLSDLLRERFAAGGA